MCGIGLWHYKDRPVDTKAFDQFMHRVLHRGPDAQQSIFPKQNLAIGANRLAIIDIDSRSNQPFRYKNYTITFNGAIYNFRALRSTLQSKGHSFSTESDTEVILHSYEEFGSECVKQFEGMWAFCIYDSREETIFSSRDRFSIKPLYYVENDLGIFFGSEQKQFRELPDFTCQANVNQIKYFLETGGFKNHNNETVIDGIQQLEGGNNLMYDCKNQSYKIESYYQIKKNTDLLKIPIQVLIRRAIEKRLVGDVQPAILLSGGLDSAIIASELQQKLPQLKSYSFIEGRDKRMDESKYINAFLQKFPHENHQVVLPSQLEQLVRECIYFQDEAPASLSTIAQFILYKLAKNNGEKLMQSGQGADESFGGYPRFLSFISTKQWLNNPIQFLNTGMNFLQKIGKSNHDSLFLKTGFQLPKFQNDKDYMHYLFFQNGLRDLLHYEDRNSMSASIETRLPFMDRDIVEYAYTISTEEKLKYASRKGLLLDSYKNILPRKIVSRKTKLAFDTPEKFLLNQDFINIGKEYNTLKERLPELPWARGSNLIQRTSEFTQWQVYFINVWLDNIEN